VKRTVGKDLNHMNDRFCVHIASVALVSCSMNPALSPKNSVSCYRVRPKVENVGGWYVGASDGIVRGQQAIEAAVRWLTPAA